MRRLVPLVISACLVLLPTAAAHADDASSDGVVGPSSALDQWAFWGYLYGDGHLDRGKFWFDSSPDDPQSTARFLRGAVANEAVIQRGRSGNYHGIVRQPSLPDMRGRPDEQVKAFLAAVIEGEGGACSGMILDDHSRTHVQYVAQLLSQLHISTTTTGTKYFRLWIPRSEFAKVAAFPFATMRRAPKTTC